MKNKLVCVLVVLGLASPARADMFPITTSQAVLALSFDLDGEAADDDQVVTSVQLADAGSYTIAAQPDACRLLDITVTDADSSVSAGVLTVTGTDCFGAPLVATFTFAAGGTGVKTLTVSSGKASAAYFKTVTTVVNGTLTGEAAGDLLKVGYTSNSVQGYPMYGRLKTTPSGRRYVDLFDSYPVPISVKNGAAGINLTTVTAGAQPFRTVAAEDLLYLTVSGETFVRKVVTRTDANNVILNAAVTIPTTGIDQFQFKRFFYSSDPQDGWFPVANYDSVVTVVQVDANANTGGVVSSIQCATFAIDGPNVVPDVVIEEDTATVASAATGTDTTSLDLRLKPQYTHCRAGVKIGTGDDADAAAEDIDIVVGFRR